MTQPSGRWPPDVVITHSPECVPGQCVDWCVAVELDKQSGNRRSGWTDADKAANVAGITIGKFVNKYTGHHYGDSGGASRFYPQFWHHTNPPTSDRRTTVRLIHGDCLDALRTLPDSSVDAVVTDPPSSIGFMGLKWDSDRGGRDQWIAWLTERLAECYRVLKPGAHIIVWALPKTSGWTHRAIEDAGFEHRHGLAALHGQGFPKNLDVSKAIDKAAGKEREVVGMRPQFPDGTRGATYAGQGSVGSTTAFTGRSETVGGMVPVTAPATEEAERWSGWGTALKPSWEMWYLARKPLDSTVAGTVTRWGTGALNIDATRVGWDARSLANDTKRRQTNGTDMRGGRYGDGEAGGYERSTVESPAGRWPADVLLSHSAECNGVCSPGCAVAELDRQSGTAPPSARIARRDYGAGMYGPERRDGDVMGYCDSGGASRSSRFFPTFRYQAKPSTREKGQGLDDRNTHPTVKPVELMRWLVRLVTPPGGTVLDPFAGSGSTLVAATLEGFDSIGVEAEAEYLPLIEGRVRWAESQAEQPALSFD